MSVDNAIDFSDPIIQVRVGTPAKTFGIHRNVLVTNSEFFKNALTGEWTEAQTEVVKLPDDEPDIFNIYVNWIYRRQVMLHYVRNDNILGVAAQDRILTAYALGDKLVNIDFKDAVSDLLAMTMTTRNKDKNMYFPGVSVVNSLYKQTQMQSKLRQPLIYHSRTSPGVEHLLSRRDDPDCLFEYAVYGVKTFEDSTIAAVARCLFHEHGPGAENCYRTKHGATAHHFADWYISQEDDGVGTDK